MKNAGKWAQLSLKLLSIIESILPAFLIAWNQSLRNRVARQRENILNKQHEIKVMKAKVEHDAKFMDKSDRTIIDDFLSRDGDNHQKK